MATPITIKKKKMTLKKAGSAPEDSTQDAADDNFGNEPAETSDRPAAFSAPPSRSQSSGASYTVFAILAAIATICFAVLVVIQWFEWKDLSTAFPRPIEIGHIAPPPS